MIPRPPRSTRTDTLFPYTTLFRSAEANSRINNDILALYACSNSIFHSLFQPVIDIDNSMGIGRSGMGIVAAGGCMHQHDRAIRLRHHLNAAWIMEQPANVIAEMRTRSQRGLHDRSLARTRSEERRVGKECVRTCISRGSPYL